MRRWQMVLAIVLSGASLFLLSCTRSSAAAPQNQTATVQRGNLSIEIMASGNLALSHKEDLAFEMAGTVAEVLVQVGDSVKQGQVVAKLDTSVWEDNLDALEDKVTAAERQVPAKERDLLQAQINLQTAQNSVNATQIIKEATDNITQAEFDLKLAQARLADVSLLGGAYGSISGNETPASYVNQYRKDQVTDAQTKLTEAKKILADILANPVNKGVSATDLEIKKLQVILAEGRLEDAQKAVEDAQKAIVDAQKTLDEAKSKSPEVKAPFDGFITVVNVKGGDEILKGKVAVTLADPTKFETEVSVSEMDIFQVKVSGNATVQVNAMPTINLSANVTRISPTATIQSGVVNYKVKVEVKSPEAVMQELQAARQGQTPPLMSGTQVPTTQNQTSSSTSGTQTPTTQRQRPSSTSGNQTPFTQGQRPSSTAGTQVPTTQNQTPSSTSGAQAPTTRGRTPSSTSGAQTLPALTSQIAQLKEGLTVTVTIVVAEKTNVLLVPNRAITRQGGQTLVKVQKDGVVESRSIKTGLSDGLNTEVTEGLSEGEQVVIPKTTTTTTTTPAQRQQQFIIPGVGGR